MLSEDLPVRDLVFPIITAKRNKSNEIVMGEFLGTGFLIGSKGYALTASHVINLVLNDNHRIVGMFVDKKTNKWMVYGLISHDKHPTEDVALLKMDGNHWKETTIKVSFQMQFSSFEYKLFGYPSANLNEDVDFKDSQGRILGRPDLIYSSGHIRRRVSFSIPSVKGKCFYELSQPVGSGCSGSPIFHSRNGVWEVVVGIYIADKTECIPYNTYNKDLEWVTEIIEISGVLAYAVRMDDLSQWIPQSIGCTLDKIP